MAKTMKIAQDGADFYDDSEHGGFRHIATAPPDFAPKNDFDMEGASAARGWFIRNYSEDGFEFDFGGEM